jgi:hypothetical protein
MKKLLALPLLALFAVAGCNKPAHLKALTVSDAPPAIFDTSLDDSIDTKYLRPLALENVIGTQIKYTTGQYACYFEYQADPGQLLQMLSNLPFPRYAHAADTTCYAIPVEDIIAQKNLVRTAEYEASTTFWDVDAKEYTAYTCLKPPLRHTLLVNNRSRQVLHRIESTI